MSLLNNIAGLLPIQACLDALDAKLSGLQDGTIIPSPFKVASGVLVLTGAGVPTDGTTGDDVAGPGSLYIDTTNANLYVQTGLISNPVWKLVTRAA